MTTSQQLVEKIAKYLKTNDNIKPPEWAKFVKTGVNKERPPSQPDWWYFRAASILKRVYEKGPIGTNKLKTAFSSRRRKGHKPAHTYKAGGKAIRLMLQQLEKAKFIKRSDKVKGRIVTDKGQSLIDRLRK